MSKDVKIGIIHYGCGNIYNIEKSLKKIGCLDIKIIENGSLEEFDILILPGVGSFKNAMTHLIKNNYHNEILEHVNSGKKLLGICLGMQLLMQSSKELEETIGLKIIKGKVVHLNSVIPLSILPHVGLNSINITSFKNENFYFDHSYEVVLDEKEDDIVYGETTYNNHSFISYIKKGNILGVQFHPEISGKSGLKFLQNFLIEGN